MTLTLSYQPVAPASPLTPIVPVLIITSMTLETKSNKKMYQQGPGQAPYLVDLGFQGPSYKIGASIDSVEYTKWMITSGGIPAGCLLTQQTDSPYYTEFPSGGIFMLDSKNIVRKGGTVDKWTLSISLIRTTLAEFYYNGKV